MDSLVTLTAWLRSGLQVLGSQAAVLGAQSPPQHEAADPTGKTNWWPNRPHPGQWEPRRTHSAAQASAFSI